MHFSFFESCKSKLGVELFVFTFTLPIKEAAFLMNPVRHHVPAYPLSMFLLLTRYQQSVSFALSKEGENNHLMLGHSTENCQRSRKADILVSDRLHANEAVCHVTTLSCDVKTIKEWKGFLKENLCPLRFWSGRPDQEASVLSSYFEKAQKPKKTCDFWHQIRILAGADLTIGQKDQTWKMEAWA